MRPESQSSITKVSRITGGIAQADYVGIGLSSPLNSTRVISFWYYGTTGGQIRPYNNDLSADLYYLDDTGNRQGGSYGINIPVPTNQRKKVIIKMVNRGILTGAGVDWMIMHYNQVSTTLSTGEYRAFSEFQIEDRAYATAYTTGTRIANLYTSTTNTTLDLTCPIDLGIGGIQVAWGNTANPNNRQSCTTGIAHAISAGDGAKTVYMAFRDSLGNTSADTTGSIILDTTLPVPVFTGSTPVHNFWTTNTNFTIQQDITELNLGQFIRSRSGLNYSLYDSGLVAMYNFDNITALGETTGAIVKDMSLYANNGTVNGATWTGNGKQGGAYTFDGINDYINIANVPSINVTTGMTTSFRVKPSHSGAYQRLVSKFGNSDGSYDGFSIVSNNGDYKLYLQFYNLGNGKGAATTNALTPGIWNHVAVMFTG